jgi:hypothetical protein
LHQSRVEHDEWNRPGKLSLEVQATREVNRIYIVGGLSTHAP